MTTLISCIVFLFPGLGLATGKQPHILFILADDYGWNDIGYHGSEIETPTLDTLAAEGVKLDNYYVQQVCTPTRSQLLSGRYQIHTGLQHSIIGPGVPNALPKEIPTLADKLKEVGYSTHIVGKWHLGFYKSAYLPTNRGFDTFFGYLGGSEDYYSHIKCKHGFCGLDFYNNLQPVLEKNGTYSTHIFVEQVNNLVEQHVTSDSDQPLFMYVPFQAVHGPLQVPAKYTKKYGHVTNIRRRIYAGMVSVLDEAVKNITECFKHHGLWDDTILVFSTDNGGHSLIGGNNYPLKGYKGSLWEGGIRGVGFVHSKLIEEKGRTTKQLMHVTDWFPTLLHLAGGDSSGLQLDGYDVWSAISSDTASPRQELLHSIDPLKHPRGKRLHPNLFDTRVEAAIRLGDWKLLTGDPGVDHERHIRPLGQEYPIPSKLNKGCKKSMSSNCKSSTKEFDKEIVLEEDIIKIREDEDKNIWLYNIKSDPNEYTDLSDKYPEIVMLLLERLTVHNFTAVPCRFPGWDKNADPSMHGGLWGPWQD